LNFKQSFNPADHVKVVGANVEHGLFAIDLLREVPEELKAHCIQIRSGNETIAPKQDNQPKQNDTSAKKVA
jgi:molecular chaperone IbpA